ncbi:ATP-binding protein [Sutcliffiella rhizosphaerae]|uniref:histidine kinase n=1 Tax=Sutcliffiella rhizosphaerae TaxID=2880967 RepID=A0ABM8YSZ4_9BACI|nr:ATP-binding protein [Sutcliffiella rhizosphaerae]CAG9622957.1 Adaptive-response sensory-kinase SasA [Sutcliffiella rhizosphaerae]
MYFIKDKLLQLFGNVQKAWKLEKKLNKEQLPLIQKKNKILLAVSFTLITLGLFTNLFIFPEILPVLLMTLGLGLSIAIFFGKRPHLAKEGMYTIVCLSFLPFWVIAYMDKDVINFFFLIMPLIMSSLYNRLMPILITSFLTCISYIYFYFFYYEDVFYNHLFIDVYYFLLFSIFVTVFLLFSTRLTGTMLLRAEEKEKRTSQELLSTKEYLEAYFNNTTDAIGVYDLKGKLLKANSSYERMFEVDSKKYIGKKTDFLSFTAAKALKIFLSKMSNHKQLSFEILIPTLSGEQIDLNNTVTPVKNEAGYVIALIFLMKDITDKKRTEEALMQSEKLSVIGELAAGVAHEIRNPVTVLKGFVQLLSRDTKEKEFYLIMDKELERINQITNEFMALAKPQAIKIKKENIKDLIKEVCVFLESEAFIQQVVMEVVYLEEDIRIDCEANQIKQVLINIIKNGMEAMPDGGKIKIQYYLEAGNVYLSVMDEGHGIAKEMLENVGKPFFTTKGQGTGLGLMVSMKIIENHGGNLTIHSEEYNGTTIIISLPYLSEAK